MEKFELLEESEFDLALCNREGELYGHVYEALRAHQRAADFLDEAKRCNPKIFKQAHEQFTYELMGYDW